MHVFFKLGAVVPRKVDLQQPEKPLGCFAKKGTIDRNEDLIAFGVY